MHGNVLERLPWWLADLTLELLLPRPCWLRNLKSGGVESRGASEAGEAPGARKPNGFKARVAQDVGATAYKLAPTSKTRLLQSGNYVCLCDKR